MVAGGKLYTGIAARAADRLGNPNTVSIRSFFTFGVSYGTASLSCTLPIFIAVVGIGSATSSLLQVVGNFFLYAIGMGLVIMVMTLGMAIFKGAMVRVMRRALPYIQPIASGVHGHCGRLHRLLLADCWARQPALAGNSGLSPFS